MLKIGDIVEWANRDIDEIRSFGIVQGVTSFYGIITVRWFDDGTVNDYFQDNLKLIQTVENVPNRRSRKTSRRQDGR